MAFAGTPGATPPRPLQAWEYELRADAERLYCPVNDAKIVDWRRKSFEALGLGELHASVLANRRDVDRQHVEDLVKAGASPEQAFLIAL